MAVTDFPGRCPHCGCYHTSMCPRIKAIEYYPDGCTIKRIEYHDESMLTAPPPAWSPLDTIGPGRQY